MTSLEGTRAHHQERPKPKFQTNNLHKIAECVGWKKLWDHALGRGSIYYQHEEPGESNYLPRSRDKLCVDIPELSQATLAEQFIIEHTKSDSSWNTQVDSLNTMDPSFHSHVLCF